MTRCHTCGGPATCQWCGSREHVVWMGVVSIVSPPITSQHKKLLQRRAKATRSRVWRYLCAECRVSNANLIRAVKEIKQ